MPSPVLTRVLLSVLAGALCGLVGTCAVLVARGPDRVAVARVDAAPVVVGSPAREVLRRWDAARAQAWTSADTAGLAALYTPGSVAGRRDVAMLRAWSERGARVTALSTQLLRLQVLLEQPTRLELVVTDRVALVRAAGTTLPHDRPSTRRIVLARGPTSGPGSGWRVESVSRARPARS
ncbi:MAG: hypothetical protein JWN84_2465 [Nocardioides sp.]|jgi:hypothetical protein|nr:hypothetical protein [Nocardioides sp.]